MKTPTLRSIRSSILSVLAPDADKIISSPATQFTRAERRDARGRASGEASKFQYEGELSDDEIRLVVLKPLLNEPPYVTCDLVKANTSKISGLSFPEYNALSYTWNYIGYDFSSKSILINGRELQIGNNLWYALHQLSPLKGSLTIWIDAICINQKNVGERNHQVMKMGEIYSEAQHVFIWLGHEDVACRKAIECIQYLAEPYPLPKSEDPSGKADELAASLKHFLAREYWKRLWIVQEVILASSLTLYCGCLTLRWKDLAQACNLEDNFGISDEMAQKCLWPLRKSIAGSLEKSRVNAASGRSLLTLLHTCQDSNSTDVRDMVYGLLGIATDASFLEVDYDKSPRQLWEYLVRLQNLPPKNNPHSITFSGDTSITVYLAQFVWDVLKLKAEDISCLAVKGSSESVKIRGLWTDTIIQQGSFASEIIAARRATRVGNHHVYRDWRSEMTIGGYDEWDIAALQSVHLPKSHRDAEAIFASGSADKAYIKNDGSHITFSNRQICFKGATWQPRKPVKLKRKSAIKQVFGSSIEPTPHDHAWDTYRFFATETGQIGWTTSDALPGDLVCRFPETDIALLLRRNGTKGEEASAAKIEFDIISRIMLLRRSGEKAKMRINSSKIFRHSVPDLTQINGIEVDLNVSIQTLATLSYWLRPDLPKNK